MINVLLRDMATLPGPTGNIEEVSWAETVGYQGVLCGQAFS